MCGMLEIGEGHKRHLRCICDGVDEDVDGAVLPLHRGCHGADIEAVELAISGAGELEWGPDAWPCQCARLQHRKCQAGRKALLKGEHTQPEGCEGTSGSPAHRLGSPRASRMWRQGGISRR